MAASKKIKKQVLRYLFTSPYDNCRTRKWLLKTGKWKQRSLERALKELLKIGRIREEKISDDKNYCLTRPIVGAPRVAYEYAIRTTKAFTTGELAVKIGMTSQKVSQVCRSLEDRGYILRGHKKKDRFFFAPITGEIIRKTNYNRIQNIYRSIGKIVSAHDLDDPKLKTALRKRFQELRSRKDLAKFHKTIKNYEEDLVKTIDRAEKKSEIREHMGIRPFYRKINTWKA